MKNFWNEHYSQNQFVYGKEPNVFFAEQLRQMSAGKIILPCEGEGRNAVFASSLGWEVKAFDSSEEGKKKAMLLAEEKQVSISYIVEDAISINFPPESADVVTLIYAHFPPSIRKEIHQKCITWLKPNGKIILEAFNPKQLQNTSGGPKELSMLYDEYIIKADFKDLKIELLEILETNLAEGDYHQGKADIIRLIASK
jgi:2-polyprenyl-3-methyl-5-hydroxy-6-metoxy-1,4-benzoquinol methylase